MNTLIQPPPHYENTLLDRCRRAYDEAPTAGVATRGGLTLVLEHLAAEIMAAQHMRGIMSGHDAARMLLEGAKPQFPQ